MFCFQVVTSFWVVVLMMTIITANRHGRYHNTALYIFGSMIFATMVLLYSDCLQLLFQIRDLNKDIPTEQLQAAPQSNFILVSYYVLVWFVYFTWVFMSFIYGLIGGAVIADCFRHRRLRRLSQEERELNARSRQTYLNTLKVEVENQFIQPDSTCCICHCNYKQDDQIVQLPCDNRHIFHYQCVELWLDNGR